MRLTVSIDSGRDACQHSIDAFVRAVESFSEYELLAGSRCHGWDRLDVVTHVIAGWQDMLGGMVSIVDAEPTVDAASYWTAFAAESAADDPIPVLMAQRRRTAAYARPASALEHLRDVAAYVRRGVGSFQDQTYLWQGQVFAAGDFLAIWAVENAVHHLDLRSEESVPSNALELTRATIEALIGRPLPAAWPDDEAVLIGTGRLPVPDGYDELAGVLPALA